MISSITYRPTKGPKKRLKAKKIKNVMAKSGNFCYVNRMLLKKIKRSFDIDCSCEDVWEQIDWDYAIKNVIL